MGRVNTPSIREIERTALEEGLRKGSSHAFRMRCQVILLKAAGRKSKEVGDIVRMSEVSVNSWVRRYKQAGIQGLFTKPGRGRKGLIQPVEQAAILAAVKANRQRLSLAKAEWQASRQAGSKPVSRSTFRSFLKALAGDINAFENE